MINWLTFFYGLLRSRFFVTRWILILLIVIISIAIGWLVTVTPFLVLALVGLFIISLSLMIYRPESVFVLFATAGVTKAWVQGFIDSTQLPLDYTVFLLVLLVFAFLIEVSDRQKRVRMPPRPIIASLLVFVSISTFSLLYSPVFEYGISKLARLVLLNLSLFFLTFFYADSKAKVTNLLRAFIFIAVLYAVVGVAYLSSVPDLLHSSRFLNFPGSSPKQFGIVIVLALGLILARFLSSRSLFRRNTGFLAALIVFLAIVSFGTNERALLLAFAIEILTIGYYLVRQDAKRVLSKMLLVIILFVIGVGLAFVILPEQYINRYSSFLDNTRLSYWSRSVEVIPERLIQGIGFGGSSLAILGTIQAFYVHNVFLEVLLETGVFGLIAFLFPFIITFRSCIMLLVDPANSVHRKWWPLLGTFTCFLVAVAMMFLSGDLSDQRLVWFFTALTLRSCSLV